MHPHTATSAILRRGLTIRDLQCPPADADTVTSITIDDTIRAAKGNFGFVYAATGDRELYRECLLAESYAKTQYVSCAIHLRRAFELLAFYTVGRALCTVTPGLTMPEAKAHAKQFYESDPRCFNPKLQLSLVLAGLGYIDVVFNERFAFSDNPAYPGCKKMVDMLFSLYSDASGMAHTGRDGGHRDCSWLLRRFYTAAGMLLQVDVPAADFFPAMDRFLHRYDASVVPLENYYPLSAAVCRQMDVCAAGDSLLCVTDEAAPTFYIAKHVTDDPAVGRDIGSLQSLWRASEQTPENVLMDVGPLGAGEDRYHMFRIVGRPYALSAKVLAGLNSTQKRQIINGIVGSIYTLHHFMPPLPHRGLRPGCYYVCRQGANCRAVLALFSTIKDNTAEKTVYGELNSLLQDVTDRMYIAPELSGGSARPGELTKADIYSLGRLIAFVYTGKPRADLDDLRIPCAMVELVQKLTDPDPARRPDIDAVRARLENGGRRLVYGAAACQGTRPRQEDVLLANGTLTARPDYTLADTAPCPAAFAVLDGIGGGYGGAEVAHAAAEALDRAAAPYLHMELADYTQPLAAIFADAERETKRFMAENGYTRSGASAALVIAASRAVYTANLGDSRVYRYTHGALTQLTRDHRFALGGRHELYQYLGASDEDTEISPTIGKIDRVAGERLLLCTDGVSEKLSDEELAAMLTAHPDAGDAAGAIIAAVKSIATDNATVLVVDL
ncbi:protein phosphatase 2C domain-containing protein [Gemmiger sp.]|uniref:protein phosphatase 2C domain-containing protein n=1 Tax=Gemmiger sp. TaxID=2049027 RepID=UPI003AB5356B